MDMEIIQPGFEQMIVLVKQVIQTLDFLGCVDTDGDGQSNQGDQFPIDATQISDIDSDGYGGQYVGIER